MRHLRLTFAITLISSLAFTLLITPQPTSAAEITISGDNCTRAGLANAVASAAVDDTITFDCSDPTINFYTDQSIAVTKPLTIDGSNNGNPIILDGNNQTNFFEIENADDSEGRRFDIANMTMQNGNGGEGGAIDINGGDTSLLVLTSVTFVNNQGLFGGAIYNDSILQVHQSTFINNTAYVGGAIYNHSLMEITQSSFVENHALSAGAVAFAGTYNAWITTSTFTGNTADHLGSTFSRFSPPGLVTPVSTIRWSTIVQPPNTAPALYLEDGHDFTLEGVIIGGDGDHCTFEGGTIMATYTIANDDSCNLNGTGTAESQNLRLGPASTTALYGTTQTYHPLLNHSPAIDAGPSTCEIQTVFQGGEIGIPASRNLDQLSNTRPQHFYCDLGAIESALKSPLLCANNWNGALRSSPDCSRAETHYNLPQDAPLNLCVNQWNGTPRLSDSCARSEYPLLVEGDNTIPACINTWNGALRISNQCTRSETQDWL